MRPALFLLLASSLALPAAIPAAWAAAGADEAGEPGLSTLKWTIDAGPDQRARGQVQLSLTRRSARSQWMHSNTRPLADLAGLDPAALGSASGGPVRFRLERDAGTIDCEGVARRWHGSGLMP